MTTAPPQPQPTTVSLAPSVSQSVQAMASMVQIPSQNLMIQQAPPQVFLAPAQTPIVYVPQAMPAAAASPATVASAPPANLFMAMPNVAAAPAPQPTIAVAASPPLAPATAVMAVASGTQPVAAVTNSTLSLPSSGTRTRVRVRGPGVVGSSLARLGERLTRFGRARIETVQETTLEAPSPQPVGAGVTSISTTTATPVSQGPPTALVPCPQQQPPACSPPCPPSQPSCPLPLYSVRLLALLTTDGVGDLHPTAPLPPHTRGVRRCRPAFCHVFRALGSTNRVYNGEPAFWAGRVNRPGTVNTNELSICDSQSTCSSVDRGRVTRIRASHQ